MVSYAKHFSVKSTPQTQPIPGTNQIQDSAGGFAWAVDKWSRLDRFLILGCEGGSYYAKEQKLTIENATSVADCIHEDGKRAVDRIVEISVAGRAPKNDSAIFALAMAAACDNEQTRKLALEAMPKVCRIGTHLFHFVREVKEFRGWGRALKRAVAKWYTDKDADDLAYQLAKYQQRDGWSHRDVLRLSKPTPKSESQSLAFRWACGKAELMYPAEGNPLAVLGAFEAAKRATTAKEISKLIREFNLPRECVPTQFLSEASVWEALLEWMPMTAMIRNLATMTRIGLVAPLSQATGKVIAELANVDRVRKARIHPIAVLAAMKTYEQGHGERGGNTWTPVPQVVDALDGAFYQAFGNVEPTNKRWLLALDVSGSMGCGIGSVPGLTARDASAAVSLVTAATEPQCHIMGFSNRFMPLSISPRQRLTDAVRAINGLPFEGTDCSLPMAWALQNKVNVDVFAVYTDSETWAGEIHPAQALKQYRQKTGINAKLIVNGMVSNGFTIADPNDAGMLDCVGFDTAMPQVMSEFARC